jgi:hypothetical protein
LYAVTINFKTQADAADPHVQFTNHFIEAMYGLPHDIKKRRYVEWDRIVWHYLKYSRESRLSLAEQEARVLDSYLAGMALSRAEKQQFINDQPPVTNAHEKALTTYLEKLAGAFEKYNQRLPPDARFPPLPEPHGPAPASLSTQVRAVHLH